MKKYLFGFIGLGLIIAGSVMSYIDTQAQDIEPVTMLTIGDMMLGRNVEKIMSKQGDEYPFEKISPLLESVDFVAANLEGPVMKNHKPTPSGSTRFAFHTRIPKILARHNIEVVSLANNHTQDYGVDGFNQTRTYLAEAGIAAVGQPFGYSDTYVVKKNIDGRQITFVGFNFTATNFDYMRAIQLMQDTAKNKGDMLVAMIHGGDEYKTVSNADQKLFYRALIRTGADVVFAHHPHVVQEVEQYNGKMIFYSLGNFLFDQYFEKNVEEGLAVKMTITKDTIQYDLIPIAGNHSQPKIMAEKEKQIFLTNLAARSSKEIQENIKKGSISIQK